eukprot:11993692-Ditylum_brightwellii.AAC.1
MLVVMDSFNEMAVPNQYVMSMFSLMLNFYISDDMDKLKSVVTEEHIPHVQVKNMPVHVVGRHCGTHIALWMLQLLRYLPADTVNMKTLREDEYLAKCI